MVLYFSIIYILGIVANFWYAGNGGTFMSPGYLVFAAIWAAVNFWLLLTFGFPVVL